MASQVMKVTSGDPLQVKTTFISYVEPTSQSFSASGGDGVRGTHRAMQVATDPTGASLARRHEPSQARKALKDFGCLLVRPFNPLSRWLGNVFTKPAAAPPVVRAGAEAANFAMWREQIKQNNAALFIDTALPGLRQAEALLNLSGPQLEREHTALATGNGALRRVATGLNSLSVGPESFSRQASELLARRVGGVAFSQWATTGQHAPRLLQRLDQLRSESASGQLLDAAIAQMDQAAADIRELAGDVQALVRDLERYQAPPAATVVEGPSASPTDKTDKEREFEAMFEKLGKSVWVLHSSSTISLGHSQIALILRAMRDGSISTHELSSQINTGAGLKLMQSLYNARDVQTPSLEASLLALAAGTGNSETTLGNISVALVRFVRAALTRWNEANSSVVAAANAPGQRFNAMALQLREQFQRLDKPAAQRVLNQLQGELGNGLRAILGAVDEGRRKQVQAEGAASAHESLPVNGLVSVMIAMLREQLTLPVRSSRGSLENPPLSLLVPRELVALARVMEDDGR